MTGNTRPATLGCRLRWSACALQWVTWLTLSLLLVWPQHGVAQVTDDWDESGKLEAGRHHVRSAMLQAADDSDPKADAAAIERDRIATAVALNYCRASFHRIRRNPTQVTLGEERDRILSNINLDGIGDADLVRLYAEVLDEIGDAQLRDREHELYNDRFESAARRRVGFDALAVSLQVATAQYLSALRTGASSWWDVRDNRFSRDVEVLKLERQKVDNFTKKSSLFLETFWKLAQKKGIPDRWLVRGEDLDQLELIQADPNPEVRLRRLKRLEPFMECYPPYWYYRGRTQQLMGDLQGAADTYRKLEQLGAGFFRRDDMLATSCANLAAIEDHFQDPRAFASAQRALAYDMSSWQANLLAARVLAHHHDAELAEDAMLRNLDARIERPQTLVALAMLYSDTGNTSQLTAFLQDETVLRELPVPVVLKVMTDLPPDRIPVNVSQMLDRSLIVVPKLQFGRDSIIVRATPNWGLTRENIALANDSNSVRVTELVAYREFVQAEFASVGELGSPWSSGSMPPVVIALDCDPLGQFQLSLEPFDYSRDPETTAKIAGNTAAPRYRLARIRHNDRWIALEPDANAAKTVSIESLQIIR